MYLGMNTDDEWIYATYVALNPEGSKEWGNIIDFMILEVENYLQFFALL